MRKKDSTKQLQGIVGQGISNAELESWISEDGDSEPVINLGLTFEQGGKFILGCAGDGGVFIRKGHLTRIPNETRLSVLNVVIGTKVEAVSIGERQLELVTTSGSLTVLNDCDELRVSYLEKGMKLGL